MTPVTLSRSQARPAVAVIGGGPAGLMAADVLAGEEIDVSVYEAKPSFARKFLLAGRGGLNLTHSEPLEDFVKRYGSRSAFMSERIASFTPNDLRAWCRNLGIETFIGSSGRVFPKSLKASPLLRAWLRSLQGRGVALEASHHWQGFTEPPGGDHLSLRFSAPHGRVSVRQADAVILATGGASWPRMGSDGAWTQILNKYGVATVPFRSANSGFDVGWSPSFADRHAGAAMKNLRLSFDGTSVRGEVIVSRYGLEGGAIYALSAQLRKEVAARGSARLLLDLRPDASVPDLANRVAKGRPKDSLSNRLRKTLGLTAAATGLIRECCRTEDLATADGIARAVKAVPITLTGVQPLARAISSAGGLRPEDLTEDLMLRSIPGVFAAGEMLDWEAPTGGYLLQGCFLTAVCAARGVEAWLADHS